MLKCQFILNVSCDLVFSTPKRMIAGKKPSIYIDVKKLQLF